MSKARGLHLHDALTKKSRPFEPLDSQRVSMYVCGPTVYNYVHIGNARPAVVFDVLFRVLRALYPKVVYARNITDIDDKIIRRAEEEGKTTDAIALQYAMAYAEDMAALKTLPPSIAPQATKSIEAMLSLIQELLDGDHAYQAEGHVLFSVESMKDYGELSGRKLDDMLAGARVEVADYKRHPGDFVLWKPSKKGEPGWDSPFGFGRPGWHLECSAMIKEFLGPTIDIHGGGRDLAFPHHENEIAQSRCAYKQAELARHWLHNGFINIDGEKMSKSLGNFRTVRDLLAVYPGEVLRYALLSAHYRSDMDFSKDLLEQAASGCDSIYNVLEKTASWPAPETEPALADGSESADVISPALLDDLNTPEALAEIHSLIKSINRVAAEDPVGSSVEARSLKASLLGSLSPLGLGEESPAEWFGRGGADDKRIDVLLAERQAAREAKDWARADEIRKQLDDEGIVLEDKDGQTRWKRR